MRNQIIKRDGTRVDFDISKIRKQILPACEGTNIDPLELESSIQLDLNHNLKTSDIQEKLILCAKSKISVSTPDWDIVAGRLASYDLYRKIWKNIKIDFEDYIKHIDYLIRNNYYRQDFKSMVSNEELIELKEYLSQNKKRDYDLILSQILILSSKYLRKNKKGIIEYPGTADMSNAIILAKNENNNRLQIIKNYYDMISKCIISIATPFKSNLRIPNGNTGSCFIGEMGDSLAQILKSYSDIGLISKEGGGIGWDFSKIRPGGTFSGNIPRANSINKWLKIVNDLILAVNQRGIRKGAITPALPWWHLDIIDFCEIKSELNGDLRDKCFDIFPQVVVDTYFINKVINNEDVYLFNQFELKKLTQIDITELIDDSLIQAHKKVEELINDDKLKSFKKIKATTLWKKFLWSWIEYGDFYITHKDNLNTSNYLKNSIGIAKCANLCLSPDTSISISKKLNGYKSVFENKNILLKDLFLPEYQESIQEKSLKVKSFNTETNKIEYKDITEVIDSGVSDTLIQITDNNNNVLICTPNHKIFTQRGFIQAKDLNQKDLIVS